MGKESALKEYVEEAVQDLAEELDPEEKIWPDYESLSGMQAELTEVITGRVADWEIEQRGKV